MRGGQVAQDRQVLLGDVAQADDGEVQHADPGPEGLPPPAAVTMVGAASGGAGTTPPCADLPYATRLAAVDGRPRYQGMRA